MAANTAPIFVGTPLAPKVRFATANTNRDGSGTLGTLFTASAEGSFFKGFRYQAEGTTTAGVIRIYVQTGGAGNHELLKELLVSAITPSASVLAASGEWLPENGFILGAGDVVSVSTHNGETFSAWLLAGGDY